MRKNHVLLIYVALALVTFVTFQQVSTSDFVDYDDGFYVTENPHVTGGITIQSSIWAFTTLVVPHTGHWQPMTWLSHMLDCQLFGLNPSGHHLTNLWFHIANTLLLFYIFKKMTSRIWPSAFVAAAFALHPLHVESVAWVTERRDVLSGFFCMLTIAAYIRYVTRPSIIKFLPVCLFFALGLMSKSILVTLPFVLLLLDYWPLNRVRWKHQDTPEDSDINKLSAWRLVIEKIPLFILSAASCVIALIAARDYAIKTELSIDYRIVNVVTTYTTYLAKTVWPTRLAVLYPLQTYMSAWKAVVSFIILLAVSVGVICMARKRRYLAMGWMWYLGILIPVIGLVQVGDQSMADRYTYLPLIGLFIMAAFGLADLLPKWRYRKNILAISAGLILVAMSICTQFQLRHWKNSFALFKRAVEVTENNYLMHNNYGSALLGMNRLDEAFKHFQESIRINPQHEKALHNMGVVAIGKGNIDQAVTYFEKALEIDPNYANAHYKMGSALANQGKYDQAIKHFNDVLKIDPQRPMLHYDLAKIHFKKGNFDLVVKHCTEALRLKPDFIEARINLARVLLKLEKTQQAVDQYYQILKFVPNHIEVLNELAWVLATDEKAQVPNSSEAIRLAELACQLTNYKNPEMLNTLATAYATAKQFEQAVTTAGRALELASQKGNDKLVRHIRKKIKIYKQAKPLPEN